MSIAGKIYKELELLPEDKQVKVLDFIKYLTEKQSEEEIEQSRHIGHKKTHKRALLARIPYSQVYRGKDKRGNKHKTRGYRLKRG
ncbi:DUF2281 domain-containing protein [Hippea sp. KM1]|uniref:DUF2281 domain-containing protein n=1 Tax=Hippea sp. KM1 TaxID=944481 RepID=UPI00046CA6BE|nr:DUF2281 domain-containing protein [Hippea sp. KM1]